MTCIVGIADETGVVMGGDSAGVSGWDLTIRKDDKVFRVGDLLIGYTTSYRMGQLLRFHLEVDTYKWSENKAFDCMVTEFVPAVRKVFKDGGYSKVENNAEEGGCFLVGFQGHLYTVFSDFQVGEAVDGFRAVGCGAQAALGHLYGSKGQNTEGRVRGALEAAEHFSIGVRGPFTVERLPC
jgi:ATP-dependent protease HslVU (ClpYQ) peptidase subunit